MSADKELGAIEEQMTAIKGRFVKSERMYAAPHEDEVAFEGLLTEAKAIIGEALGPMSEFRVKLNRIEINIRTNFYGGPSYDDVCNGIAAVAGAIRHLHRRQRSATGPGQDVARNYVNLTRIYELQHANNTSWDTARLVQLCIELNAASAAGSYMTTAMLVRAIVDHVPPVLGCATFSAIANNYPGSKSFRASMQTLDRSLRNIADAHLHTHIRRKEALPNETQVDFRADLDVLLAETERVLKGG